MAAILSAEADERARCGRSSTLTFPPGLSRCRRSARPARSWRALAQTCRLPVKGSEQQPRVTGFAKRGPADAQLLPIQLAMLVGQFRAHRPHAGPDLPECTICMPAAHSEAIHLLQRWGEAPDKSVRRWLLCAQEDDAHGSGGAPKELDSAHLFQLKPVTKMSDNNFWEWLGSRPSFPR